MGDLVQLNEPNVRLKNKQASLNDAMQLHFAAKVDFERAAAEFERMENEIRIVLERTIAAHKSGQQSRTNIAYKVATKYGNKLSQSAEKIKVECL